MKKLSNFLGPISNRTEQVIKAQPILFSLIILYQGLFSVNAIKIPTRIKELFNNKTFRFLSVWLIAFSATQDIEYSLIATVIFLLTIYALKTPEERKETGLV